MWWVARARRFVSAPFFRLARAAEEKEEKPRAPHRFTKHKVDGFPDRAESKHAPPPYTNTN